MRFDPWFFAALSFVGLLPLAATAGNGVAPRTPVQWDDVPCLTVVDRSQEAVLHIPYAVPREDTDVGVDEVADSRTHQFLAFCRQHDPQNYLPSWIAEADVAAALAKNLIGADDIPADEVFETSAVWADCWFRINADDDRRPITNAAASEGVDWDTSVIPPGVYAVEGYTYEPRFNIFEPRPGVVKVHDGDPDAVGPAAAVTTGELTPFSDEVAIIEGCVQTLPGSTLTAYWAPAAEPPIEWTTFVVDEPVDGDAFVVEFTPPQVLVGSTGMIRIDITDPMDRTYSTYMKELILVIPGTAGCEGASGSFIGQNCDASSGTDSGTSADASGESTATDGESPGPAADEDTGTGCGCGTRAAGPGLAWIALLSLGLAARARWRRAPS